MKKKNIILIMTDQHRKDTLSCYGGDKCQTPHLDQLAGESVIFDNAYTTCAVCSPARSSIHTGVYPSKSGFDTNTYCEGCRTNELEDTPYLLSRLLNAHDYNCGFTGKWHLGDGKNKPKEMIDAFKKLKNMSLAAYYNYGTLPTDVGFIGDDFPGHGNGGYMFSQYKNYLKDNNLKFELANEFDSELAGDHSCGGEVVSPQESTNEYFLVERAKTLIDEMRKDDKPFYFSLNFWGPHAPYYAPTKFLDMYRDMNFEPWESFSEDTADSPKYQDLVRRKEADWEFFERNLRYYYGFMSSIDHEIGRFIEYLKQENLYDDTIIIFTADHGDSIGCHGGLENKSCHMYEETTNIPMFMKPAQDSFEPYRQSAFVGTCDVYGTILDLAGVEPDEDGKYNDGVSMVPFIENGSVDAWREGIVTEGLGAFSILSTQRMFRYKKYKYVFNSSGIDELYNLEDDPHEIKNLVLVDEYSDVLKDIKQQFCNFMAEYKDPIYSAYCKMNMMDAWDR